MNLSENLKKWTVENSFDKTAGSIFPPQWPHEILVKIFSSKAYSRLTHDIIPLKKNEKVLEIGCMGGNNIRFFSEKGCVVSGIEVTEDLVSLARSQCNYHAIKNAKIVQGNNQSNPFDDETFDILISVNTLHYEHGSEKINTAISNFWRVLKPGGVAFIETVGPEHFIYQKATKLDTLSFRSNHEDFRKNDLFGFFSNQLEFKTALQRHFTHVEVITLSELYENIPLQFFIGIAKK